MSLRAFYAHYHESMGEWSLEYKYIITTETKETCLGICLEKHQDLNNYWKIEEIDTSTPIIYDVGNFIKKKFLEKDQHWEQYEAGWNPLSKSPEDCQDIFILIYDGYGYQDYEGWKQGEDWYIDEGLEPKPRIFRENDSYKIVGWRPMYIF